MNKQQIYIIGDGPAGSATALSLIKHLRANKADKELNFDIYQVCATQNQSHSIGETIPPAATEWLTKLGVEHCLDNSDHLECPGSVSQWGSDQPGYNDFFFTPIGKGFHLNRKKFNEQLLNSASEAGITTLANTKLMSVKAQEQGTMLTLQTPDGPALKHADFVVDATGIQARVARSLNVARNEYDSVISTCVIFELPESYKYPPAHTIVSAVAHGWWYACRLPNNKALISFCTDKESLKQGKLTTLECWKALFKSSNWFHRECVKQFGNQLNDSSEVMLRVAPSAILSCVIGQQWLAVGDAASSYDSMTSAGITKSLQQGWQAGKALALSLQKNKQSALEQYQDNVFQEFSRYLRLHQELYHCEQRYSTQPFWARRQRLAM